MAGRAQPLKRLPQHRVVGPGPHRGVSRQLPSEGPGRGSGLRPEGPVISAQSRG